MEQIRRVFTRNLRNIRTNFGESDCSDLGGLGATF